jgi:hypothetical protein
VLLYVLLTLKGFFGHSPADATCVLLAAECIMQAKFNNGILKVYALAERMFSNVLFFVCSKK